MPRRCCVPFCGSNGKYGRRTSTFIFPKDANKRKLWLRAINRQDYVPTSTSSVCIKHFQESHVIRIDTVTRPDGKILTAKRIRPKLALDAVPTIFPDKPKFDVHASGRKRTLKEIGDVKNQDLKFEEWKENDQIESYEVFVAEFENRGLYSFDFKIQEGYVCFYAISFNNSPKITTCFKVFNDLEVQVFFNGYEIPSEGLQCILGPELRCNKWSTFDFLLRNLDSCTADELSVNTIDQIKQAASFLEECINNLQPNTTDDVLKSNIHKLKSLKEEINLTISSLQYSTETSNGVVLQNFTSPEISEQNCEILILSNPSIVHRVTANIDSIDGLKIDQLVHLRQRCCELQPNERIVNILFDEVMVPTKLMSLCDPDRSGMSVKREVEPFVKVQAFMISSVFMEFVEVVALYQLKNISAILLKNCFVQVLKLLTEVGFTVLSLIGKNSTINCIMYYELSKNSDGEIGAAILNQSLNLKTSFVNPFNGNDRIFLLFDMLHIFNSIKNDWLNQKDKDQSFIFPHINDSNLILRAKLHDVKKVYLSKEKDASTVKLTKGVLFPLSVEKSNVTLADRLFDEKLCDALKIAFSDDSSINGAAEFIYIISTWWKIVNDVRLCKSVPKGLRENLKIPVRDVDDENVVFLKQFCSWLNSWRNYVIPSSESPTNGKLEMQTLESLLHTTVTLISIVEYALHTFNCRYLLLGKFQTYKLEDTFGNYARQSGITNNSSLNNDKIHLMHIEDSKVEILYEEYC